MASDWVYSRRRGCCPSYQIPDTSHPSSSMAIEVRDSKSGTLCPLDSRGSFHSAHSGKRGIHFSYRGPFSSLYYIHTGNFDFVNMESEIFSKNFKIRGQWQVTDRDRGNCFPLSAYRFLSPLFFCPSSTSQGYVLRTRLWLTQGLKEKNIISRRYINCARPPSPSSPQPPQSL